MNENIYLGGGVYLKAWPQLNGVVLTTEDGVDTINTIYLQPEVIEALLAVLKQMGRI